MLFRQFNEKETIIKRQYFLFFIDFKVYLNSYLFKQQQLIIIAFKVKFFIILISLSLDFVIYIF